nr:hypothetical protein [Clostridia bacterium]
MLRRILMLLMICTLLLLAAAGAEELYDQIDAALYRIVLRTDEGDKTLGSGALFLHQTVILTARGCCPEGKLYAIGTDGEHEVKSTLTTGQAALLELATPSSAAPLTLAPGNAQSLPFLFGANHAGQRGTMPLYNARADMQDDMRSILFSSAEGLLPGAFLTDQEGRITALITGQRMEGLGSYTGLGADTLEKLLSSDDPADSGFMDCTFQWEDGKLTVSWTDTQHTDGVYVLTLICGENQYYTTYEARIDERSMVLTPPPGHTYAMQVERTTSEAAALAPDWDVLREYTLPLLPFTAYGFQSECAIVSVPAGAEVAADEPAMTAFTSAALTDPQRDVLLSVHSSYDVSAKVTAALALELRAPDGQFFFDELTLDLDPAAAGDDSFLLPLDDLLQSCAKFSGGALKAGEYTVRFFLDGCKAGETAFTLTEEETALTPAAPASEGFAAGLTAKNDSGLVTLTWDPASLPEGAKVRAYCLYDGNPYFIYHDPQSGVNTAQFFTVPGRRAMLWVAWTTADSFSPALPGQHAANQYVLLDAPARTPYIAHSFRNVRIGLAASADPKAGSRTDFLPQAPITRKMLTDRSTPIYFMTEDAYRISATSGDHPLLIVFETPEGMCFTDMGSYTFDISLQSSDLWLKDVSKLFADYEALAGNAAWPAGEYRLLYCIDEKIAGEIKFTLE